MGDRNRGTDLERRAAKSFGGKLDMMMVAIALPLVKIAKFCHKWQVIEFALFGSVLRDDFRPDSDIDMLVTFDPHSKISLMGFIGLEAELEDLLHRKVDLVSKQAVEQDRNWLRRKEILSHYQTIYESRPVPST